MALGRKHDLEREEQHVMDGTTKKKLAAGAVAVAALAGGGAALAASGVGSSEDEQAIIDAAATKLGVKPEALESALEDALAARIDAAVTAGRLTKEQGAELKERLEEGALPLFGGRGLGHHGPGFGFHGPELLDAAASYLDMTEEALRTQIEDGTSLSEVAESKGKSVSGLKTALTNAVKADLADAVKAGKLTDAQRDEALSRFEDRLDDLVAREGFGPRGDRDHGPASFERSPGMHM
jgi:hypothetical protein